MLRRAGCRDAGSRRHEVARELRAVLVRLHRRRRLDDRGRGRRSRSRSPRPSRTTDGTRGRCCPLCVAAALGVSLWRASAQCTGVKPVDLLSYFQAIVIGLLQGVTELFPISSLGHSVLIPAWLGWDNLVERAVAERVVLPRVRRRAARRHRDRAARLLPRGLGPHHPRVLPHAAHPHASRRPTSAWRGCSSSRPIPAGITGLVFEHTLRTLFAKPLAAAIFLTVNGVILLVGEWVRRRRRSRAVATTRRAEQTEEGAASTRSTSRRPARSASRRSARCSRASAGRASRWSPASSRPRPRRRGALLVPARDADHLRRRPLQDPRPRRSPRRRHPRAGARRQPVRRLGGLCVGAIPDAVLRDPQPAAVRDLLPGLRRDLDHPLQLTPRAPAVAGGAFDLNSL